ILKVARKYNLRLDAYTASDEVKRALPMWFHVGASPELNGLNNHVYVKCLRANHHITSVGQLLDFIDDIPPEHHQCASCSCQKCRDDRQLRGCSKPMECQKLAQKLLNSITPKWNPRHLTKHELKGLTPAQIAENEKALCEKQEVIFNPNMSLQYPPENGLLIFGEHTHPLGEPAMQSVILQARRALRPQKAEIFLASEHRVDEDGEVVSGGGSWFGLNDTRNLSMQIPENLASKNSGLLSCMLSSTKTVPKDTPI
ncbi:hypothetical protein BDN67DRAFT_862306, partial [Paxillus ammoniavirescens]